jgi:DNA polymerase-3 subunit delta'
MSNSSTASKLDRLIGLQGAKTIVSSLVSSFTETHALLFYGAEGSGKEELARITSHYWLCTSPDPTLGADGTCRGCNAFERGTNADILWIRPLGAGNQITIRQFEPRPPGANEEPITPLLVFMRTPPLLSRNKVVVISQAERMNEAASNTLLKTLEEPPSYLKLILTTTSPGAVRSTILSRVLSVSCSLPSRDEIELAFPKATPDDILMAESAPGRLSKILDHPNAYRDLVKFAHGLLERPRGEALAASEELRGISEKLERTLESGMRAAHAEVLRTLSLIFARDPRFPSSWTAASVQAHSRVLANVNAGLVIDAMFARCLQSQ